MSAISSCISNIIKMTLLFLMSVLTSLTTIFWREIKKFRGGENPRVPPSVLIPGDVYLCFLLGLYCLFVFVFFPGSLFLV